VRKPSCPSFREYKKARLWIAGTGSYELYLRHLAGGSSNIRFLGEQSAEQLQNLYRGALAVIVPSLCFEIFSLVIGEAFAERTPVIARSIGGMPELIQQSGGGFLYQTDEELLEAMRRIVNSPALRSELGEKGYLAFLQHWSSDAHFDLYFDLIRKVAARKFGYTQWPSWEQLQPAHDVGASRDQVSTSRLQ
jgi:glycosyltransferase involved in cell wall biosynthesis